MQVKNLPDLIRIATGREFNFPVFYTSLLGADEAKACILAVGEEEGFYPELITSVIDLIAEMDPNTGFVIAKERWISIYVCRSKAPVEEIAKLLNDSGPCGVDVGDEVPELEYWGPALVRAWWDWE